MYFVTNENEVLNTHGFSRREFLASTSAALGAIYAMSEMSPVTGMADKLANDSRISPTPLVDKGFASIRKIGNGLYATVSDTAKGLETMCNGGFLVGKDSALLLEGYVTPAGAAFQMETLRMVSQVPIKGALVTHHHFDHSLGNSFYGTNVIPLWAHQAVATRMVEAYAPLQSTGRDVALETLEKRIKDAKNDVERVHAQVDLSTMTNVFRLVNASLLALPNRSIDPATLPMKMDLGGLTAIVELYPGHSGTDLIVRVPDQNVVYTGDLLFNGVYPLSFDKQATVSGWRATLKTFASWDKDTLFVPGHGQLCGQEAVQTFAETFDDIAEQAEKLYQAGVPVEEAQHRYVVPDRFKNIAVFSWGFSVGPTITKLYSEWEAKS